MSTPLPDLLRAVDALNDPSHPFVYEVAGDTVVGKWDIVKATSLYPTSVETIDKKFSVTVEFDQKKGTFTPTDKATSTESSLDKKGLHFGASTFSGTMSQKTTSFTFGGAHKTDDGVSGSLHYSFDTAKIKKPLFALLEQNGWKKKRRGLFG